jgi:hypothetical protein
MHNRFEDGIEPMIGIIAIEIILRRNSGRGGDGASGGVSGAGAGVRV